MSISGTNNSLSSKQDSQKVIWSDEYFKQNFMEFNKLDGRVPFLQTIEYSKAFLNWFVSGKGAGKILDVWIGLVSGMLVPTTSISYERLLLDEMFRGKTGEKGAIKLDPLGSVNKITDFIYGNEGTPFSSCEAKTWYYSIYDMLDSRDSLEVSSNSVPASALTAINYLGYLAMSLLKLLVKDAAKISQHILKNVTNEFNGFWQATGKIKVRTPPPHKFAVKQFGDAFQKLSPNCIKVMTLVVASYAFTESINRKKVREVLKTACLEYLELYGMGCLYWLQKAESSCSIKVEILIDYMGSRNNGEANKALRNVMEKYGTHSLTWRWARFFVDQTFTEISTSKNPAYAATMAALSCKCDDKSPIWKISQFRDEKLKNEAILRAQTILELASTLRNK